MLPKATALISAKNKLSATGSADVESYISERISNSVASGYTSTKCWVKRANLGEAYQLLSDAGYQYETLVDEPNSVQLSIKW